MSDLNEVSSEGRYKFPHMMYVFVQNSGLLVEVIISLRFSLPKATLLKAIFSEKTS